jgi:hypothetical protein
MGRKPKRYQHQRCLHFITFSCYRRMPLLDSVAARDRFEDWPDPIFSNKPEYDFGQRKGE